MKQVWIYPLASKIAQTIAMREHAKILSVQCQPPDSFPPRICIWALVETTNKNVDRTFHIVDTGKNLPEGVVLEYLATCQTPPYVWHVFEEI